MKPRSTCYDLTCKRCGKPFQNPYPFALYCGPTCRNGAYRQRRSNPAFAIGAPLECPWCGIVVPRRSSSQVYCAAACAESAYKAVADAQKQARRAAKQARRAERPVKERPRKPPAPPLPSRICEHCGRIYPPRRKDQKYCQESCERAAYAIRHRGTSARRAEHEAPRPEPASDRKNAVLLPGSGRRRKETGPEYDKSIWTSVYGNTEPGVWYLPSSQQGTVLKELGIDL